MGAIRPLVVSPGHQLGPGGSAARPHSPRIGDQEPGAIAQAETQTQVPSRFAYTSV